MELNEKIYFKKSKEEREMKLKQDCEVVEIVSYHKEFTKTELTDMKDEVSELLIRFYDLENDLKDTKQTYTDAMAPLKKSISRIVGLLKYKARIVDEECYKFIDREKEKVAYYNIDGLRILERPIQAGEMQRY